MSWIGIALTYSLLGGIHCAGMCGGFAMLSLKSPSSIENSANQRFFSAGLWAYLLAKATSYGVLGVALGFVGSSFHATPLGMRILAIVVGTVLIFTGLQIGGFNPFERFKTGRIARETGSASSLSKMRRFSFWLASRMSAAVASVGTGNRFLLGLMNGFLPCGLLYAALDKIPGLAIEVLVLDVSLPGISGLDLQKQIQIEYPSIKTLMLSRHDESLYAERAIRAGARGYIMKSEPPENSLKAIRRIITGAIYVSTAINERLLQGIANGNQTFNDSPLDVLSDRELEVFEMTGKGIGTRLIAEKLHLSMKTIESYRARVKTKLNLANASELMQHAVQWVENESGTS